MTNTMDKITQMPEKLYTFFNPPAAYETYDVSYDGSTEYHHNDTVEALHTQLEAMAYALKVAHDILAREGYGTAAGIVYNAIPEQFK